MEDIIKINNLSFRYNEDFLFDNFKLNIKKGSWTTIAGPNGSGKSTLIKIILGLIKTTSQIEVDGIVFNNDNLKEIRKRIGIVFDNPDNQFVAETVQDDIAFALENLGTEETTIKKRIVHIAEQLDIKKLLDKEPHMLSGGEKQKVAIAAALALNPPILILDEAFTMLDPYYKKELLKLIKEIQVKENLTILNITHDLDESLYGDEIVLLNQGKLIMQGKTFAVLKQEKLIHRVGLEIPFMVDLSIKLGLYDLIDGIIIDMEEMVDQIWK